MDYINEAVKKYETLLREQVDRCEKMKNALPPKDFAAMEKIIIGVIDGDGIGPIIMKQALKVLNKVISEDIKAGKVELKHIEGLTIENRQEKGEAVPRKVLEEIKACDVILKGPTTTPKGGTLESANVTLRRELDLFANVRPITIPEESIDWMFFRENTEGEYVLGSKGIEIPEMLAMDFKVTTDIGTKRIARAAFKYAKNNSKTKVSIITKANIMKKTDGKFSKICNEIANDYPGIECDEWYIDIMSANLVDPKIRNQFQVFILPNLYGDIITDEAAQIQGGVGTAGSANIGDQYAMFEAIHGSAPRLIELGQGHLANPSSIMKAAALMLSHIGFSEEAIKLENIVNNNPMLEVTCEEYGDIIANKYTI